MKSLIVNAQNLKKTYKLSAECIAAVDGINFQIAYEDFVSIMGPSGSGKTTLLDMIGCLDSITSGKLEILGNDVSKLPERKLVNIRRRKIGFIFQDFSLIPSLTTIENIQLILYFAGIKSSKKELMTLLDKVGLSSRINHLPKQLSGGEKQRVAIARALATKPDFLLADEPTGHLDSYNSQQILNLFKQLNQEDKLTIIVATHDQQLGEQTKRKIYLKDGKIVPE